VSVEDRAHALAAGLFTLILGAALVVAAMWFSGDTYQIVRYVIESKYSVSGLNVQSSVRLRGVEVGKVESIQFDPRNSQLIMIGISVRAGTPITQGTVGQLRPQGLTGLSYVMLDDDGSRPEPLPPNAGAHIPMRPSFMEQMADSVKDLAANARQVTQRLNNVLSDENQAHITRALANLETATQRVVAVASAIEPAAKAAPGLVAQARQTFAEAQPMIASITAMTQQLSQRAEALDRVAKSAEQVGGAAQSFSHTVVDDTLPRINQLADQLTRTAGHLDRLLRQLRDRPSSVVFGPPRQAPGPGEAGFRETPQEHQ
jgi:phospholipid/cholesterol/gamma-HCH transport system substrate-binding protein